MLLAYPLTGGSFNPARAFGPELISGSWTDAWIWYVGPLAGGAIAALLYDELYLRPASPEAVGPPATGVEEPGPGGAGRRPLATASDPSRFRRRMTTCRGRRRGYNGNPRRIRLVA